MMSFKYHKYSNPQYVKVWLLSIPYTFSIFLEFKPYSTSSVRFSLHKTFFYGVVTDLYIWNKNPTACFEKPDTSEAYDNIATAHNGFMMSSIRDKYI